VKNARANQFAFYTLHSFGLSQDIAGELVPGTDQEVLVSLAEPQVEMLLQQLTEAGILPMSCKLCISVMPGDNDSVNARVVLEAFSVFLLLLPSARP